MMATEKPKKSCKNRKYKRWVIVFFTESNDYSVVPVNWLILPTTLELTALNISLVELCRWPPFHVTSVELINADDPEDTWGLFKIKILSNKIYANFKEAWHQRVEIESSATENELEVLTKKKKNRQRSSSEDDSDFEDCSLSVTSFKIGVYMVDTSKMSELYCINLTDIKYKCFFIRLSDNLAFISSLCHSES